MNHAHSMTPPAGPAGEEFRSSSSSRGLPPEIVRQLNQIDDWRAARSVAETVGATVFLVAIPLIWWHPLVILPVIFLVATRQQALVVLAHDATHYRLFSNRAVNDVVGCLCGAVVGISMRTYRVIHRLHHNHLYEPVDPDMALQAGYPRGQGYLPRKLFTDLFGKTAWKTYRYFFGHPALNVEKGAHANPLDDTTPRLRNQARRDRQFVVGLHITMLVCALTAGYGLEYVLLWLLPLATALQPILRLRAICEHGAIADPSTALKAARTNIAPAWLRWLFFPHFVNFHTAHHLYPAVPHYNLPACHNALADQGLLQDAEIRDVQNTWRIVNGLPATA